MSDRPTKVLEQIKDFGGNSPSSSLRGVIMIYTLTILFWQNKSVSVETEQDILPQVGSTICLVYDTDGQKGSEFFQVVDVIHYPLKKDWSGLLGRGSRIQVYVDAIANDDDLKVALITSSNNRHSLGEWKKGTSNWTPHMWTLGEKKRRIARRKRGEND